MSVLKCPDCGNQVSDKAPHCPHCGRPIFGHLHEIYIEYADKAQSQGDAEQADKWLSRAIAVAPADFAVPDRWRNSVARARMALYREQGEQIRQEDEVVRLGREASERSDAPSDEKATLVKRRAAHDANAAQSGELGDFYDKLLSETGDGFVAPSRQVASGDGRTAISPIVGTLVADAGSVQAQARSATGSEGGMVPGLTGDASCNSSVDLQGLGTEALDEVKRKKKMRGLLSIIVAVLLLAGGAFAWIHFQAKPQATSSSAATHPSEQQVAHQILLGSALAPDWVLGQYEGEFSDEHGSFTIDLSINADGTIFQHVTSQGKVENISGTVSSYDKEKGLGVLLDGMASNIFYPVDTINHRLSVGDELWLIRKK